MSKKNVFLSVQFLQSVELAGAGYSVVGGPGKDGVYNSVPASAANGWYWDALVKDGLVKELGEGSAPDTEEPEAPKGFSAQVAEAQSTNAVADAAAANASNAAPPTDEQKASNAAVVKATAQVEKATAAAKKTAPAKSKK